MEQMRVFARNFFESLKCDIFEEGEILVVSNVPKSFEDLFGKIGPYRLSFVGGVKDAEFVGKGSAMFVAMRKFLEGAGKATLLRIDFSVDAEKEIRKVLSFKNCEIGSLTKKYKNSFFSRFSFVTVFNYMNESERVVNEIYVHNGKVVEGDLDGYDVVDGEGLKIDSKIFSDAYRIARENLKERLISKTENIGAILKERVEVEVDRVREHYDKQLSELGGDLREQLEKIKKLGLEIRVAEEGEKDVLRERMERLRRGLLKMGDDDARSRILKEQEFTIRDIMQKFSLNVDNKLLNTTVIYYPCYFFKLYLKKSKGGVGSGEGVGRFLEVSYDPLTKSLSGLNCEACSVGLSELNICEGGHVVCSGCLEHCGECGRQFCQKCLSRSCSVCGRVLCKNCSGVCFGCGKYVCSTHMRTDCVSGDERCLACLRACLRCHGMAQEKFFGEALDGSKVCSKCLGKENLNQRLKFSL